MDINDLPQRRDAAGAACCFVGIVRLGPGAAPRRGAFDEAAQLPLRRATSRRESGHERLRLQRLVDLRRRRHDRSACSPAWCCCSSRRAARSWCSPTARRQHHRPRLGRRPARAEQPAAALVDVAVRHHGGVLGRLPGALPGPGQRAPARCSWSSAGQYEAEQARRRARRWRRCTPASRRCGRAAGRATRRRWPSASACSSTTAPPATAPTRAAARASRT